MAGCTSQCAHSTGPAKGCDCACGGVGHGQAAPNRTPAVDRQGRVLAGRPPGRRTGSASGSTALREHVEQLCKQHGLTRGQGMPGSAFAAARLRLVVFDEVTGETSYLDALHEIAHNAEPAAKRSRPLLEREANAWTWALSHSQIPLTIEGRRHIAVCLLTYMRGRRSNTRLPPSEHPFWRLAGLASPAESTRRAHGLQTTADEHARTAREALLTAIREDERGPRLAG